MVAEQLKGVLQGPVLPHLVRQSDSERQRPDLFLSLRSEVASSPPAESRESSPRPPAGKGQTSRCRCCGGSVIVLSSCDRLPRLGLQARQWWVEGARRRCGQGVTSRQVPNRARNSKDGDDTKCQAPHGHNQPPVAPGDKAAHRTRFRLFHWFKAECLGLENC